MTSIKDLEPCRYFPVECEALTAIGWFGREATFETGLISEQFFFKLKELRSAPWQPIAAPMRSMDYNKQVLANGGRSLVRLNRHLNAPS